MAVGLFRISLRALRTVLHSRGRGSRGQRSSPGFILHILSIFHLQILFHYDMTVYTVRSRMCLNGSFLTRLIVVSLG